MYSSEITSALSEIHRFTSEVLAGDEGGPATNLLERTRGSSANALRNSNRGGVHEVLAYGRGALQRLNVAAPELATDLRVALRALQEAL